jgi:hypothetical protein
VGRSRAIVRYGKRILVSAASLAAAILVALLVLFHGPNGSADVLAEVIRAWEQAKAHHFTGTRYSPTEQIIQVREWWELEGVGRREEFRHEGSLTAVIVDNGRWRFQHDLRGGLVAVQPSELVAPSRPPIGSPRVDEVYQNWVRWEDERKTLVARGTDRLDGKQVSKATLRRPDDPEGRSTMVWFDPSSYRPLKVRNVLPDGSATEFLIDYPAQGQVPVELFRFQVPRSATLEMYEPQFGRWLYSKGETGPDLRQ